MVAFVGPTAVGKSALALELANEFSADIVCADSRQVYRYMDIGTNKPSPKDQARIRHYMLDLVSPDDTYSVQRYVAEGTRVLQRIRSEERVAFAVGGTGFYIRGLLDRMSIPEVPPEPQLRDQLRHEAERLGAETLHRRLATLDPNSAARVHPNNLPRLIRALEIVELTGRPVPTFAPNPSISALFIGLTMGRDKLRRVAAGRIDEQIEIGLVAETERLLDMGFSPDLPALDGFGYRQMMAHLRGETSLEQAARDYRTATYKYIRRQMTWFRGDKRIHWIESAPQAIEEVRRLIADYLASRDVLLLRQPGAS